MPPPLEPGDHYVLRKLSDELLPWLICSRRVGRQWFVYAAAAFNYVGDFAAALAGLGIGAPAVALMQGKLPDGSTGAFEALKSFLPPAWWIAGAVALAVWIVLRLVIQRQEAMPRALLAREHARAIDRLYAQLYQQLAKPDPLPGLNEIQKSVNERVLDDITNKIWPFSPALPPPAEYQAELTEVVVRIRSTYMHNWTQAEPGAV